MQLQRENFARCSFPERVAYRTLRVIGEQREPRLGGARNPRALGGRCENDTNSHDRMFANDIGMLTQKRDDLLQRLHLSDWPGTPIIAFENHNGLNEGGFPPSGVQGTTKPQQHTEPDGDD